jgi:hypothetical protein
MVSNRYAAVRNDILRDAHPTVFAPVVLRDADSNYVPIPISERLVHAIWYEQRFAPESLCTTDGRPVRVIFPGWWNVEAGPDFRNATVQFADEPERSGDVEIHLRGDDWFHHRHEHDPLYNDVVLHVVLWESGNRRAPHTRHGDTLPQVVLQHHLAAPLEALYDELDLDAYPYGAGKHGGNCVRVISRLSDTSIVELLDAAGDERFTHKVSRFARWLHRGASPEQVFYEGWMEALGYKANKAAFRSLARRVPHDALVEHRPHLAAMLFGVANFLPTFIMKADDAQIRRLWNVWWKLRPDFADKVLPPDTWRLHGVRPANHPHRRLGAAVALLKKHPNLMEKVIGSIESDGDPTKFFLQIRDDYWSRHCMLGGRAQAKPVELIGAARAQEIVTNIVLPFVAAFARSNGDHNLEVKARSRYAALRAMEANSLLRLASGQFFATPAGARRFLRTERRQQGLMQVFQDFCLNDKSVCQRCHFPEFVNRWVVDSQRV